MPTSSPDLTLDDPERRIAIQAECAYLVNLLALPLVGALYCLFLSARHLRSASPALRQHLLFTTWGSFLALFLLGGMTGFYYLMLGTSPRFWFNTLIFLSIFHTSFVIVGLYTLANSLSGKGL